MDIQRTILWVIFGMSLLFLWDSWQRHQGRASMLSPPAVTAPTAAAPADAAKAAPTPPAGVPAGAVPA
ncbi:MAG: membrane protein insertase YidC, partial [Betaproteobacteria bacterium]